MVPDNLRRSMFVLGYLGLFACGGEALDGPPGAPPSKPSAPPTDSVESRTYVIRTLTLGEAVGNGSSRNYDAWKKLGFNLDGKVSTRASTDVCTPVPSTFSFGDSGNHRVHENGDNGIDNAFGAHLVPLLEAAYGDDLHTMTNDAIAGGAPTQILQTVGLTSALDQTNVGLSAQVFFSARAAGGTGTFAVDPFSLADGRTLEYGATTQFDDAYIVGGTWVSGRSSADLKLPLVFGGVQLELIVHHAVITFAQSKPGAPVSGIIAGVLDTDEVVAAARALTATSRCEHKYFAIITDQISQASDILRDGTNVPGRTCDGISIGVGFTAEQVDAPLSVGKHAPVSADACKAISPTAN